MKCACQVATVRSRKPTVSDFAVRGSLAAVRENVGPAMVPPLMDRASVRQDHVTINLDIHCASLASVSKVCFLEKNNLDDTV